MKNIAIETPLNQGRLVHTLGIKWYPPVQSIFKGIVQRDGKLGSFDRSSLKKEAQKVFRKIRPSPILSETFKV